jgi:hypothetical protein
MTSYIVELASGRWLAGGGVAKDVREASTFGSTSAARLELAKAGGLARYPEAIVLKREARGHA